MFSKVGNERVKSDIIKFTNKVFTNKKEKITGASKKMTFKMSCAKILTTNYLIEKCSKLKK